jgi:hypothetical protein
MVAGVNRRQIMIKVIKGRTIINTTPHPIDFLVDGEIITIGAPDPDFIISAKAVEVKISDTLVTTKFVPTEEGERLYTFFRDEWGFDAIIVGSIVAAQAYPEQVVAMTPAPGFERVPPSEKRMNPDKFTVFLSGGCGGNCKCK